MNVEGTLDQDDPYVAAPPSSRRRGVLADEVAGYVRQLILTGSLRPGTKIDQDAVGRALDVSRSPIREALVVLGHEGLLDLTPRRGASVAQLRREDIIDHYELFGVVSGRAAAMAAELLDEDQIRELNELHSRFTGDDQEVLQQLNHDFHRVINLAAPRRTRWLLRHLERTVPANYYEFADGWNHRAVEHHASILEAITRRDPEGARSAMEGHLHESGVAAADQLEERGFFTDPDTGGPAEAGQ
ncbi:MAG: GntR family transcriptional regulator [Acidimicrobiia bacterium]|nr:GntR family transcriptional regulator [Acidimicrobiia bacterium]MBL6927362.1 GntR family transcriptional regulator [Acidimicrobiia bacterium]